jgi:hypothetical protein
VCLFIVFFLFRSNIPCLRERSRETGLKPSIKGVRKQFCRHNLNVGAAEWLSGNLTGFDRGQSVYGIRCKVIDRTVSPRWLHRASSLACNNISTIFNCSVLKIYLSSGFDSVQSRMLRNLLAEPRHVPLFLSHREPIVSGSVPFSVSFSTRLCFDLGFKFFLKPPDGRRVRTLRRVDVAGSWAPCLTMTDKFLGMGYGSNFHVVITIVGRKFWKRHPIDRRCTALFEKTKKRSDVPCVVNLRNKEVCRPCQFGPYSWA